jgi:hypothetical protein
MTAETETATDAQVEAQRLIGVMRAAVETGEEHWFTAVLQAIRYWPLAGEEAGERTYRYLVGGEAFDWLLLAERLCEELTGHLPDDEVEALLFHERLPLEMSEEEFRVLLGAKYRPHLNFVYGVRVEAALQVAVQEEVRKEHHATRLWEGNGHIEDEAFNRIYGKPRAELFTAYNEDTGRSSDWLSLADLSEWRYWLFQYRVKNCDPAKVASDTRKGLLMLQHLDRAGKERARAVLD